MAAQPVIGRDLSLGNWQGAAWCTRQGVGGTPLEWPG